MTINSDRATFGQIAKCWAPLETFPCRHSIDQSSDAATDDKAEAAMLSELVAAILNREFERDGEAVLQVPDETGAVSVNGVWVPTVSGRIAPPNYVPFSRVDLVKGIRNSLRASGVSQNKIPTTPRAIASVPFSAYSDVLKYGIRLLTISRDEFANWCESRGWPFPDFWVGPNMPGDKEEKIDALATPRKGQRRKESLERDRGIYDLVEGARKTLRGNGKNLASIKRACKYIARDEKLDITWEAAKSAHYRHGKLGKKADQNSG
jgi:hypothetical protein